MDGTEATFYGTDGQLERDGVHADCAGWEDDRHHFRLIISPEHGERIEDLESYVRSVMADLAADLREAKLDWVAINHHDTGHPHAHVLIRGRRANGRDLVIPRKVISHGIREQAEARAQALLGDQSRSEAERGLFARATADRWTDIDARLAALADRHAGIVPKSEIDRHDVFGAVTRMRIAHLQRLGLVAAQSAEGVRFDDRLKARLDGLQAAQDKIRSHWAAKRDDAFQSRTGVLKEPKPIERQDRSPHAHEATPNTAHDLASRGVAVETTRNSEQRRPAFDVSVDKLTPLDVELARRGQIKPGTVVMAQHGARAEELLKARAEHLVAKGDAIRQAQGVGFKPEAWARLRDREVLEAIRDQLGMRPDGKLGYGRAEGVVAGTITTSLGRHAVIDRGVGLSAAPMPAGQELAVGQVIGRGLGVER